MPDDPAACADDSSADPLTQTVCSPPPPHDRVTHRPRGRETDEHVAILMAERPDLTPWQIEQIAMIEAEADRQARFAHWRAQYDQQQRFSHADVRAVPRYTMRPESMRYVPRRRRVFVLDEEHAHHRDHDDRTCAPLPVVLVE